MKVYDPEGLKSALAGMQGGAAGEAGGEGEVVLYAKIGPRVKATLIDGFILMAVFAAAAAVGANVDGSGAAAFLVWLVVWALYDPVLVSRTGGTIGHRLQNLRVVSDRTGGNPSLPAAFVRNVVKGAFGLISLLVMAGDARNKAFHDMVGRTTVQARNPLVARLRNFRKVRDEKRR